jgi:hypothetical protein
MTKGEILAALEPFTDECPVIVRNGYEWRELVEIRYGVDQSNDGLVFMVLGDRALPPKLTTGKEAGK